MKKLVRLRALALMIAGIVIFSAFGLLQKSISLNLPSYIQSYVSANY